jgi:hypothetical protein
MPLAPGLDTADDLPHTVSSAITYRMKIDSLNELPENKRPPRDLWTKPHKLKLWLDDVFDIKRDAKINSDYTEIDLGDVE